MAVTFNPEIATAPNAALVTWHSDKENPEYRIYLDHQYVRTTRTQSLTVTKQELESKTIEVLDDEVTHPKDAGPASKIFEWNAVADAKKYRVEQLIDAEWVPVKDIASDVGRLKYTTPPLGNSVTEHELRVTSVGQNENESSPVAVSVVNVRHPDPPAEVTMTYNNSTNEVQIAAA